MDKLTHADQQAYFKICLDQKLEDRLSTKIEPTTTIFGAGGCIEILNEEFDKTYPLASRRYEYFSLQQDQEEKFSDYAAKLQQLGREADLAHLSIDQTHVFRYITGCADDKLREKFLAIEDPNQQALDRIVKAYERGAATTKRIDSRNAAIKQVQGPKNGNGNKSFKQNKGGPQQGNKKPGGGKSGEKGPPICWYCGKDRHQSCLLYTSPSPRDKRQSRMPSSA